MDSDAPPPETIAYAAGSCNIDPVGRQRRRLVGHLGAIGAITAAAAVVGLGMHWAWSLLVLPIATGSALGYLQARRGFCVAFALHGVEASGAADDIRPVADPADRARDRALMRTLLLQAVVLGGTATALVAFVASDACPCG